METNDFIASKINGFHSMFFPSLVLHWCHFSCLQNLSVSLNTASFWIFGEDGVHVLNLPLFNRNTADKFILSLWWSIMKTEFLPAVFPVWPLRLKMSLLFDYKRAQRESPEIDWDVTCVIILKRAHRTSTGQNKLDKQDQMYTSEILHAEQNISSP